MTSTVAMPATERVAKRARLAPERVAPMPSGANLIEVDGKSCTHEVAWPPGQEGGMLPPPPRAGPPAREYPFPLDPFQQTAVNALEAGHSVLVAAHTSAGKTVVAEYAFGMALRDGSKVVYTSPLKALSNQKYRELQEQFGDVGLMTGDVTINPNASCLVMTTEILRSMLYRGSEVVRQLSLIVYDEVHYLRDKERGVVWEESIILAPKTARFAFLSATIPNAREFAEWVAQTHGSPCDVVYTDYRPTPLEHYVFPAGGDGLFLVVDSRGSFREDNFQKAVAQLQQAEVKGRQGSGGGGGGKGKKGGGVRDLAGAAKEESDIFKIVRMIADRNFDPVIVFSFSKRECEALAQQMQAIDMNGDAEKKLVDGIFNSAIDCLSEEDRRLPQIGGALPMLRRGIGVHHSGLLPILKEVIEILFQEGLLKVLFATETFSTGLNMPAKTVVFTHVRKYDGGGFRWVRSGEYIQMSGRAGRRGLDDKGVVILMMDEKLEPAVAKDMIKGAPDTLYSEFHLEYSMLLNLLRVEGVEPEQLMARSYRQFQMERALPELEARVAKLEAQRDALVVEQEESVTEYLKLSQQLAKLREEMRAVVTAPQHCLPFLQPGRLVRVLPPEHAQQAVSTAASAAAAVAAGSSSSSSGSGSGGSSEGVLGVVVNFELVGGRQDGEVAGGTASSRRGTKQYLVDVLCNCSEDSLRHQGANRRRAVPIAPSAKGSPAVIPVALAELAAFSSIRVYIPQDLRTQEARERCCKTLGEVERRFPKGLPQLDPVEDMRIEDEGLRKLLRKAEGVEGLLGKHPLARSPTLAHRLDVLLQKQALHEAVRTAKKEAKAAAALICHEDLKARRRVLRRLQYTDDDGVVTLKGRFAAELSTGDELVLTEMVFAGVFSEMSLEQLCALMSCFIWRERSEGGNKLRPDLEGPYASLREAARKVAKVAADCKMELDVEEYVESFRPDLTDLIAMWCRGVSFADLYKQTEVFEGSLVRAIRRLEELLRQVAAALKVVGEVALAEKFESAIGRIKRDIVFAASLYL